MVGSENGVLNMSSDLPIWSSAPSGRKDKFAKRPDPMKPKPGTFTMVQVAGCSDNPPSSDELNAMLLELQNKLLVALENSETIEDFDAWCTTQLEAAIKARD